MNNLNSIPKSGSYGAGVDLHNDNYQKIGVELQTLRELGQNDKGYFETLSALQTKYPTPQSGWQAYVKDAGSSTGYYVANVNSSGNWVVTAAEAPPINVDLAEYAKTGGSDKTVKEIDDTKANHGYSSNPKSLKTVDEQILIKPLIASYVYSIDGTEVPNDPSTGYKCTDYVPFHYDIQLVQVGHIGVVGICLYDKDKIFLGDATTLPSGTSITGTLLKSEYPNARYVRFCSRYTSPDGHGIVHPSNYIKEFELITEDLGEVVEYNVTQRHILPVGEYYNSVSAKTAVPSELRMNGLSIVYQSNKQQWVKEQFFGDVSNWSKQIYWRKIYKPDFANDTLKNSFTDWGAQFNGINSHSVNNDIILSAAGDYIEFDLICESTAPSNGGYSFSGRSANGGTTSITVSLEAIAVRDKNNTWLVSVTDLVNKTPTSRFKLKILRLSTGIQVLINDVIEYTGNIIGGDIVLQAFGSSYQSYGWWKGTIFSIKTSISGEVKERSLFDLEGFNSENITPVRENLFLSDLQNERLIQGTEAYLLSNANLTVLKSEYDFYGYFNGVDSKVSLPKQYKIDAEGDYIEIECEIYDPLNETGTSYNGLSLIGKTGQKQNVFGFYSGGYWAVRGNDGVFANFSEATTRGRAKYKLAVVGGNWQLSIDDVVVSTKPKGSYLYIDTIGQAYGLNNFVFADIYNVSLHSDSDGDFSNSELYKYIDADNVELGFVKKDTAESIFNNPKVHIEYNPVGSSSGKKQFYIYCRIGESPYYARFELNHGTDMSEIFYRDLIEIDNANLYKKSGDSYVDENINLLTNGESEFVLQPVGGFVDHCGGVHGDETFDWMKFYVDGVELSETELSEAFTLDCDEFSYIQKSNLHETAKLTDVDTGLDASTGEGILTIQNGTFWIDGIDTSLPAYSQNSIATTVDRTVSKTVGNTWQIDYYRLPNPLHPVWGIHHKHTTFKQDGYITKNRIEWLAEVNNSCYTGISCIAKSNAESVHNEEYEFATLDRLGGYKLENTGLREIYYTNPTNKLSAFVTSKFVGDETQDQNCIVSVWDSHAYNKYYRKTAAQVSGIGDIWRMECEVRFGKRVNLGAS